MATTPLPPMPQDSPALSRDRVLLVIYSMVASVTHSATLSIYIYIYLCIIKIFSCLGYSYLGEFLVIYAMGTLASGYFLAITTV